MAVSPASTANRKFRIDVRGSNIDIKGGKKVFPIDVGEHFFQQKEGVGRGIYAENLSLEGREA